MTFSTICVSNHFTIDFILLMCRTLLPPPKSKNSSRPRLNKMTSNFVQPGMSHHRHVKAFTAELLAGESVMISPENKVSSPCLIQGEKTLATDSLKDFYKWLQESRLPISENVRLQISLNAKPIRGNAEHLVFYPSKELLAKNIIVGVGCERGTEPEELISLVLKTLVENEVSSERVALVVSIDLKSDEPAVHALAEYLSESSGAVCPVRFFDAATLEAQTPHLQNPSEIVFQEVGCHGVAEGAALAAVAASGSLASTGKLLVAKIKSARATCAVAESEDLPDSQKIGRARGTLFIVGTGPGTPEWRLPEAEKMLRRATDWVGYGLYLDLISDLHNGQELHYFDLGQEEVRVRHALNLAAQGKTVALVSSGDPGIYAMATLVFELLETGRSRNTVNSNETGTSVSGEDSSARWQRIHVEVTPGISALQAASSPRAWATRPTVRCTPRVPRASTSCYWCTPCMRVTTTGPGSTRVAGRRTGRHCCSTTTYLPLAHHLHAGIVAVM